MGAGTWARGFSLLTWCYTSDTGFFRLSRVARAAATLPQAPALRSTASELTAAAGQTVNIPVLISGGAAQIDLTADMASAGVAAALCLPQTLAVRDGVAVLPLKLPDHLHPGYGITVSLRSPSDIRLGMPGPCRPLIHLDVTS